MNPDIHQEIYGMPEYMGALLSASLSHSADLFRKMYYENGSHAVFIPVPTLPPSARSFPRHLRVTNTHVFVHLQIPRQYAQLQGLIGKNTIKKIVQICALLCSE